MIVWTEDKRWSDLFITEIQSILGRVFFQVPPAREDEKRNTDLFVLQMADVQRIACRIRRDHYRERYGNEFTIRTARPGGTKTELEKIQEGWGDYLFYGFGSESGGNLTQWTIVDLAVFRANLHRFPQARMQNHDGSSDFMAFDLTLVPEVVKASSRDVKWMLADL